MYGTTVFGGQFGGGSVFTLTPDGSGGYTEAVVLSFDGADGDKPAGNVVPDGHGDLYGSTSLGGEDNWGTVFELTPASGGYTETVLYSFTGFADGQEPVGAPVVNRRGDVFGVTEFGGAGGHGVVFEVKPTHDGYAESVLHDFPNTGSGPQAGLTRAAGATLYGTTYGFSSDDENGSVFSLRLTKKGPVYQDLYDFEGGSDGADPFASLLVADATGVIYGTTEYGGTGTNGTVFSLTPSEGGYTERVLHSFVRGRNGVIPDAPLLQTASGDLYGTANIGAGGCRGIGCGAVFRLERTGSGYRFHVVYRFVGPPDGAEPQGSGVAAGAGGELFGTTRSGGSSKSCSDGGPGGVTGCGIVYELTNVMSHPGGAGAP